MPEQFTQEDLERWATAMHRLGVIKLVLPGGIEVSLAAPRPPVAPTKKLTPEEKAKAEAEHRDMMRFWSSG